MSELVYSDAGGSGFPAIFLHGSGCDSADWAPVIQKLPREIRAVTFDFRGHGSAAAPADPFTLQDLADDVVRLTTELAFQRVLLVGHSLGGMAALEGARQSSRIVGLVLLEAWTRLGANNAFDDRHVFGNLSQSAIDAIRRKAEETHERFGAGMWERFWASLERFNAYEYLQTVKIPIVEVYGTLGKRDSAERMLFVPANPHIEWVWIPGAGHYLPHECPGDVARICVRALRGLQHSQAEEESA